MRLYIIRHGQTVENINGILQGQTQGTLSDMGKEQAKKLALRLKDENFDIIYCSDLKRAKDTAAEINKYHDKKIIYSKDLRERDFGKFNGKKIDEVDWEKHHDFETEESMKKRASGFLENIEGKKVLVVGHRGINKVIISLLLGTDEQEDPKNASLYIFEIKEKNHMVLANCVEHL